MYIQGLLTTKEPTLIEDLGQFFENYFEFFLNKEYPNLHIKGVNIFMICVAMTIGIIIASFAVIIDKRVLGDFVRKLRSDECLSKEQAKTLGELGYDKNFFIKNSLCRGVILRSVVTCVEEEEHNEKIRAAREEYEKNSDSKKSNFVEIPYKIDPKNDHFYIPDEKKYKADIKFNKRGTTWGMFWIVCVLSIVLGVVLLVSLPQILDKLDMLVGSFAAKTPSNII